MDTLPHEVIHYFATKCTNTIIQAEFALLQENKNTSLIKAQTVWTKFKTQLTNMLDEINTSKSRYVRCINPNKFKLPGAFDLKHCVRQLRSSGLVSAITVSRSSFPNRLTYSTIL